MAGHSRGKLWGKPEGTNLSTSVRELFGQKNDKVGTRGLNGGDGGRGEELTSGLEEANREPPILQNNEVPKAGAALKKSLNPRKVLNGNRDELGKAEVLGNEKMGSNIVNLNLASDPRGRKKSNFN